VYSNALGTRKHEAFRRFFSNNGLHSNTLASCMSARVLSLESWLQHNAACCKLSAHITRLGNPTKLNSWCVHVCVRDLHILDGSCATTSNGLLGWKFDRLQHNATCCAVLQNTARMDVQFVESTQLSVLPASTQICLREPVSKSRLSSSNLILSVRISKKNSRHSVNK